MASPERALIDNSHGDPEQQNETPASQKDSNYSWFVCACGFVIQIFILGVHHAFGVFFIEFVKEFGVSKSKAAWVGSMAYGLSMTFGPVVGMLVKRWGNRAVMMTGACVCAFSMLVSSFTVRISQLFGCFSVLYGIGTCMCTQPTMTIAPSYFDKQLTMAVGMLTAGSSVGTLVMAPLSQKLIDTMGWRNTFRVYIGTCLLCVVCASFIVPLDRDADKKARTSDSVDLSTFRRVLKELRLWKNRVFIVWTLSITSVMFGYYIPYVHLVSYATDVGISPEKGSIIVMLLGACTAIGRVSFGKIVQLGFLDRVHMHQVSMVITGTGVMLLPMITTFEGILAYVICMGLVDGCYVVLLPVLTTAFMGPEDTIVAWGFLIGTSSITFTLGPPVAGALYDAFGSYNVAFHCAGIPVIVGAVILFFIPWAQRTNIAWNVPLQPMNEIIQNEYDFTDDLLYGPRSTAPTPSTSTLNSGAVLRDSSISLQMAPIRGLRTSLRNRAKLYQDQSTATSPGSASLVPMDIQDALNKLEKTRDMLEQVLNKDREETSKRSVSELIQNQTRPEHVLTNALSIMSVPVGLRMSCSRCQHNSLEPLNQEAAIGSYCNHEYPQVMSPTSQPSLGSSLQSKNLSDYQVNTDGQGGGVGCYLAGCLSPDRRTVHPTCSARPTCSSHHTNCTHDRPHTDSADRDEGVDFDKAIFNQVETLRETLMSPTKIPTGADSKEDGLQRDSSSDFQLIEQSDLEPTAAPVYLQDTAMNRRDSSHKHVSPMLEVIEEVPVPTCSTPADSTAAAHATELSSEAVETWLKNSPNDTQVCVPLNSDGSDDKDESLASGGTVVEAKSDKSSPTAEIDVFTHLFDDNDNTD